MSTEVTASVEKLPDFDENGCLLGSECSFEYCDSGARIIIHTGNKIRNREDFILETDPFKLFRSAAKSPIVRSVATDRAFEIFAANGDVEHALEAALLTTTPEATINRMLRLLPHSVRVFDVAEAIADEANEIAAHEEGVDLSVGLHELIQAHLEADRQTAVAPDAGTIAAHGELIHEAA